MAGVISYKFLSGLFDVGKSIEVYNTTIKNCIGAMRIADETKKMSENIKYTLLEESGMPILELDSIKNQDEEMSKLWRIIAINSLLAALPKHIMRNLKFKDWNSAMRIIDEEMK